MEINIFGYDVRVEYIILCILLIAFIPLNSFFSCAGGVKEGFEAIDNLGANLSYMMGENIRGSVHDIQFTNGNNSTLKDDIEKVLPPYVNDNDKVNEKRVNDNDNKEREINIYKDLETNIGKHSNLSSNSLSFFDNTTFNPECCPSNYSTSSGCACMTPEQMKFLGQRGGNRTLDIQQ
jgi:hypothetical protein